MQARGPLMIEHRLIERMLSVVKNALSTIDLKNRVDVLFVDTVVDFIRVYADRTHHGKEEDILFRDLGKKHLKEEDEKAMKQLVEEHKQGRRLVRSVAKATEQYRSGGDSHLVSTIRDNLQAIVEFYPTHIEKEDKVFFPASMGYFSQEEQQSMLSECWEFDRNMIHEKYKKIVEQFE